MVGWHHQLDGHEFEEGPGVGDGQGSLGCCSPWGHKNLDMTLQPNCHNPHEKKKILHQDSYLREKKIEMYIQCRSAELNGNYI